MAVCGDDNQLSGSIKAGKELLAEQQILFKNLFFS
jgi:hypothetical protein